MERVTESDFSGLFQVIGPDHVSAAGLVSKRTGELKLPLLSQALKVCKMGRDDSGFKLRGAECCDQIE